MLTMSPARKKRAGTLKPTEDRPTRKRVLAAFKGSEEFAAWLERFVAHKRLPVSILIEHALIAFAKQEGFDEAPPER
jgi:hypothetical protein